MHHADCRSEVIDADPLDRVWERLAQTDDSCINGDHCFGYREHVESVEESLDATGWVRWKQVSRLGDWIRTDRVATLTGEVRNHLDELVRRADEPNPDNLKDKLFFEERLGNMPNGFFWSKLHLFEGFRPLLDEDVTDFVCE